jgi:hypothetical protein
MIYSPNIVQPKLLIVALSPASKSRRKKCGVRPHSYLEQSWGQGGLEFIYATSLRPARLKKFDDNVLRSLS